MQRGGYIKRFQLKNETMDQIQAAVNKEIDSIKHQADTTSNLETKANLYKRASILNDFLSKMIKYNDCKVFTKHDMLYNNEDERVQISLNTDDHGDVHHYPTKVLASTEKLAVEKFVQQLQAIV